MDFGDLSENPFAVELTSKQRTKRRLKIGPNGSGVTSAAKLLLLVAASLAVTLIVGSQSKRWLAHQLTHDFDALTSQEKQVRLIQIADLGPLGIETLVGAMTDENLEVARAAYDLLRHSQNEWTVLDRSEIERRHATLVRAINSVAVQLPDDRTGWGTSLLQQTLMATIDRSEDSSVNLYREATHAIELMSLSDRSGPSILSDEPLDPLTPKRLTVHSEPLPVTNFSASDQWTDWPPEVSDVEPSASTVIASGSPSANQTTRPPVADDAAVYRSATVRLQPIKATEPVILRDINQPHETAYQTTAPLDDVRSVTHIVDSPMETFDDKSVMHWLGSPHVTLREKAKLELIARGYDGTQIAIATQIASGDTRTRIELIDAISRSDSIDPRPWLLMLLDDESRDVKLRVISVLATMNDAGVGRRLRMHLADERDPTVAARIRRVLDLR